MPETENPKRYHSSQAKENDMVALAYDLVERRLREGTATSQETCHFLKIGSTQHKLEMDNLREENKLLRAKTEALESAKSTEEMYRKAIESFQSYQPTAVPDAPVENV